MLKGHGGDIYGLARELGCRPEDILDFSSNCSPLPYPDGFHSFIMEHLHQLHWLPEVDSHSIRLLLSEIYNLPPEAFLMGNGTTEWIFSIPLLAEMKQAVIPLPTYSDYIDAARLAGLKTVTVPAFPVSESLDNKEPLQMELLNSLDRAISPGSLVYLCNPNNPTGQFVAPSPLMELISSHPDSIFVVDESYAQFVGDDHETSLITHEVRDNLIVLRSFSKIYGIPGLRVGSIVGRGDIFSRLEQQARPWSVNRMAQLALHFLLGHPDLVKVTREFCQQERNYLIKEITAMDGIAPIQAATHFFLAKVSLPDKSGAESSRILAERLRTKGILIRDCSNFIGLDKGYIRISPNIREANNILLKQMQKTIVELRS